MSRHFFGWTRSFFGKSFSFDNHEESPQRYKLLRRNMILIMALVTLLPLFLMALINYYEYQKALKSEIIVPLRTLVNKTKHSFELFLTERLSAVSFIASAYSFHDLADQKTLNRVFRVMKNEFGGFVDLGLIDSSGLQVSYVGPYKLKGKKYKDHDWFQEVSVRGSHISDVFMGYRKFPHFVIAVKHEALTGERFILRATIDTEIFNNLIASMSLDPASDAFIINRSGVFQTSSKFYGKVLEKFPLSLQPVSYEPNVLDIMDHKGREILLAYTYFVSPSFIMVLVKPRSEVLKSWYTLKSEIFFIFVASVVVIFLVVFKLTDILVKRIEESDQRREMTYRRMEHTNKLASIGRLAAGVAHEINNPMAIINEKAGLMEDLIVPMSHFPNKEKFLQLTESIRQSIDRCSTITHRLLGFARRMDVEIEAVDLNEIIMEVLGFLEKEAFHRSIEIRLQLADDLSQISSDHGQLQQVFLNIFNNAFTAVEDGGMLVITSWNHDPETVAASIQDNGVGISEDTRSHIFDPFFSTRKGYGTGLGLSITYGIVKKLGGNIEVQSKEGEGATFTVFLPKKAKIGAEA
ncbi:MAG: two-component sensor histidine kinase [Deltaproteobacteria bacterium]|nr:two-component sensor histidine kinase [Deltaproteobacteria bacterium]